MSDSTARKNREPKILIWDLETIGVNALKADLGYIACFGFKWLGEKTTHCYTLDEFHGFKRHRFDDKKLLTAALAVMEEADMLVAHYGDYFDRKFLQGRCAINGLNPPPTTKQRDTCLIARRAFKFSSNRLDSLARTLGCRNQKQHKGNGWPNWWLRVLAGDRHALRQMARYCRQDVRTTEDVYMKVRVYDHPHPRLYPDRNTCGVCGGEIQYRGIRPAGKLAYRRFVCKSCGRWDRETKAVVWN